MLHRSVDETADGLGEDAAAYRRWVGGIAERWDELAPMLTGPLVKVPRHPLVLTRFGLPALAPASRAGRIWFDTDEGRALFAGCAAHAFLPLDHLMTSSFGLVLMAAAHAVGWPVAEGGSQRIATALAACLEELGGEIRTGEPVTSMAQLPPARAVLFDLAPRQVATIAGNRLPERFRDRLHRYRHGPAAFKVDYASTVPCRGPTRHAAAPGTVHLGGTAEEIGVSEAETAAGRHPERPYMLVAQQSLVDPSRAPVGKHTLWTYCHVPNGSDVDMTERMEAQLERFAPGFKDLVLARHVAGPAWFEAYNPAYVGGDIAGGSHGGLQLLLRQTFRLQAYRTPDPSIFLCSASTPPGRRRPRHVRAPRGQRRAARRPRLSGRPARRLVCSVGSALLTRQRLDGGHDIVGDQSAARPPAPGISGGIYRRSEADRRRLERPGDACPGGWMPAVPTMPAGMIGAPLATAMWATPVWPGARSPSRERVPSG